MAPKLSCRFSCNTWRSCSLLLLKKSRHFPLCSWHCSQTFRQYLNPCPAFSRCLKPFLHFCLSTYNGSLAFLSVLTTVPSLSHQYLQLVLRFPFSTSNCSLAFPFSTQKCSPTDIIWIYTTSKPHWFFFFFNMIFDSVSVIFSTGLAVPVNSFSRDCFIKWHEANADDTALLTNSQHSRSCRQYSTVFWHETK